MKKITAVVLLTLVFAPATLFAKETKLTTYYPAPYGDYKNLKAAESLNVPVKTVGNDTAKVTPGEIWVEG